MMHRLVSRITLFVFVFAALQIPLFAADTATGNICGKVYQSDMKTVMKKGEVRVVNATTGEAKTAQVDDDGCYCVKGATIGNYSVSYSDGTAEFMLADKVLVQNKVVTATCVAEGQANTLSLMQQCKLCKKGFPLIGWIVIGAGGAAGAAAIAASGGEEPVASTSQP